MNVTTPCGDGSWENGFRLRLRYPLVHFGAHLHNMAKRNTRLRALASQLQRDREGFHPQGLAITTWALATVGYEASIDLQRDIFGEVARRHDVPVVASTQHASRTSSIRAVPRAPAQGSPQPAPARPACRTRPPRPRPGLVFKVAPDHLGLAPGWVGPGSLGPRSNFLPWRFVSVGGRL